MASLSGMEKNQRERLVSGELSRKFKERYVALGAALAATAPKVATAAKVAPVPPPTVPTVPTVPAVVPPTSSPPAKPAGQPKKVPKKPARPGQPRERDPDELVKSTVAFTEGHNFMLGRNSRASLEDALKTRYVSVGKYGVSETMEKDIPAEGKDWSASEEAAKKTFVPPSLTKTGVDLAKAAGKGVAAAVKKIHYEDSECYAHFRPVSLENAVKARYDHMCSESREKYGWGGVFTPGSPRYGGRPAYGGGPKEPVETAPKQVPAKTKIGRIWQSIKGDPNASLYAQVEKPAVTPAGSPGSHESVEASGYKSPSQKGVKLGSGMSGKSFKEAEKAEGYATPEGDTSGMSSNMTRKHFNALASEIAGIQHPEHRHAAAHAVMRAVRQFNPRFDEGRFLHAAGVGREKPKGKETYAQPSDAISSEKAKKILEDGEVKGHPLTPAQKRMFGAAAGKEDYASGEGRHISRDPFGRTTLVKHGAGQGSCDWCGQKGKVHTFTVEHDAGREEQLKGKFCSTGCMRDYHG